MRNHAEVHSGNLSGDLSRYPSRVTCGNPPGLLVRIASGVLFLGIFKEFLLESLQQILGESLVRILRFRTKLIQDCLEKFPREIRGISGVIDGLNFVMESPDKNLVGISRRKFQLVENFSTYFLKHFIMLKVVCTVLLHP